MTNPDIAIAHSRAVEDAMRNSKANPYAYDTNAYRAYEAKHTALRAAIEGIGECLGTDEDVRESEA